MSELRAAKPAPRKRRLAAAEVEPAGPDPALVRALQSALLPWFHRVKRDLPWRRTSDPYAIWLSEVMLQQTRVETVIPYYDRFLRELPTVHALAEAPSEQVMKLWSGLGYYRRARLLHDAAREIAAAGAFPESAAALEGVRGIGPYTAGAVASIAFGERAPVVDGNVVRVFSRLFAIEEDLRTPAALKRVWAIARAALPERGAGDWNQALMELGATTCIPRAPRCLVCPASASCLARQRGLERALPHLAPKAAPSIVRQFALVARVRGKVVLVRRRVGGLFAGLWEPPGVCATEWATAVDAAAAIGALLGVAVEEPRAVGRVEHVLSHRRLDTTVLVGRLAKAPRKLSAPGDYDALLLASAAALPTLGISTYASRLLSSAEIVVGDA